MFNIFFFQNEMIMMMMMEHFQRDFSTFNLIILMNTHFDSWSGRMKKRENGWIVCAAMVTVQFDGDVL